MAVTTVDRRTLINDADSLTSWTGPDTLVTSPRAEGTNSVGGAIAPGDGQTTWYYTPGAALDLDGHLLYIQSHTNAIQNGWKESTLSDSSHMLYVSDGTNALALCQAGNDRDVFKHAKTQVAFQSFVIDLDYLSTKDTAGEIQEISGTVASFVETSVDDIGSAFHVESKALGGGQNCFIDIMRYDQTDTSGDSTSSNSGIFIYGGGSGTEGTFAEVVTDDESNTADKAFGVMREYTAGVYGCQGILKFGTTNTAGNAYFKDTDFSLTFENRDINDDKLKIFVFGNSTNTNSFELSNGTISSAGPGVELDWDSTWINTLNINNVTFKDLGRVINFPTDTVTNSLSHAVENSTFDNVGKITVGTVDFDDNTIINSASTDQAVEIGYNVTALNMVVSGYEGTAGTSALNYNINEDPDGNIDGSSFTKGTALTHAIEFGTTSPLTMTVRGMTSTGFNASDAQNDSTFHVKRTSGTVTINVIGGTGNFTYKTDGAAVSVVVSPVTIFVHATDINGTDIQNARVFLKASNGTGPFPFEETVTISNSGVTATVTHTAHGMATNDYINIDLSASGSEKTHYQNDGVFQITYISASSYSYTMPSDPGSSPTGTITATFVALTGLTDVNGDKSTSRVYPSDQPVTGWVRLTPQYKTAPLFGAVDDVNGYNSTGVMIDD